MDVVDEELTLSSVLAQNVSGFDQAFVAMGGNLASRLGNGASYRFWLGWSSEWYVRDQAAIAWQDNEYFLAGSRSSLQSCLEYGYTQEYSCDPLTLTDGPDCDENPKLVDFRGAYAASSSRVWFVGVEQTNGGLGNAVIASYDGNNNDCGRAGPGLVYYDNDAFDEVLPIAVEGPGAFNAIHGAGSSDVWAVGNAGTMYRFDGSAWMNVAFPLRTLAPSGATASEYTLQAVYVDAATGVHIVGHRDYLGIPPSGSSLVPACRAPFYLHAKKTAGVYTFNRLETFPTIEVCNLSGVASTAYEASDLRAVLLDIMGTGDLYLFGWGPTTSSSANALTGGVVIRMQNPL